MSGKGPQREKTLKVLVIGATGRVGSEVVKALLQRGAGVRAFSRKQPKPGAFSDAVEVALRDLNDPLSVAEAMKGADKLFLLIGREGVPVELTQAVTAYGLAKRAGLKHVTFVSVFKADQFIEVPHFANKYAVEEATRRAAPRSGTSQQQTRALRWRVFPPHSGRPLRSAHRV
jgi:uncharacterized protein YbjT (DUF2867 family)